MKGTYIDVTAKDGGKFKAYLAKPEKGSGPGILLLQEIFGVNAGMRHRADELAAAGYAVLVPDLFWRQERNVQLDPASEADRAKATRLFKGLSESGAVEDCILALGALREQLTKAGTA